jgi:hypothetical protein
VFDVFRRRRWRNTRVFVVVVAFELRNLRKAIMVDSSNGTCFKGKRKKTTSSPDAEACLISFVHLIDRHNDAALAVAFSDLV